MSRPVIVLKLGGSVLRDADSLRAAVHEIYRWLRAGYGVVAVVSALQGATDALLETCRRLSPAADGYVSAAVAAGGELHCAALLSAQLDRAGVPACVLPPGEAGLSACGDPLAATPVALDPRPVRAALGRGEVAIVPGFFAPDDEGRTVTFGRGGSDLTALFLAARLGAARCRLVKDVDGVYEDDPAATSPPPRRFARATWDDALATDGSIVQHAALRFARSERLGFELGRLNGTSPTRIGPGPRAFAHGPDRPRPLRVVLLGLGTVGSGVWEHLRALEIEVPRVIVRDPDRARDVPVPRELLVRTLDARALASTDVVVETIGGREPAGEFVARALRAGRHVVTANKDLLASEGARLRALARANGARLLASAAVGGSVPVLERLRARDQPRVVALRAVLNGTTNFVLERMRTGCTRDEALAEARRHGFAEGDPGRDLSGRDAADKLCLLAAGLGYERLEAASVPTEGLTGERLGREPGVLRQVASLRRRAGGLDAAVRLERLTADDPLVLVPREHNAVALELADGSVELLRGKGAGRWPTAEAILGDLLELVRATAPSARLRAARRACSR